MLFWDQAHYWHYCIFLDLMLLVVLSSVLIGTT